MKQVFKFNLDFDLVEEYKSIAEVQNENNIGWVKLHESACEIEPYKNHYWIIYEYSLDGARSKILQLKTKIEDLRDLKKQLEKAIKSETKQPTV